MSIENRLAKGWIVDPVDIPFQGTYSRADFQKIRQGFLAPSMDHKWNFRFESPSLWLDRSWTSFSCYRVDFTETEDGAEVSNAVCTLAIAERDGRERSTKMLRLLIGNSLLGQNLPYETI